MGAGDGEGIVHGIAGGGEGVGLGEGAMVFEVFFAATGEGGVVCCSKRCELEAGNVGR